MFVVKFQKLDAGVPDEYLPRQAYPGDAGMDLHVYGEHTLGPGESRDLPSGIAAEFPPGFYGRITGRSSTLRRRGLFVNEGIIDAGYRGELMSYITNRNAVAVVVEDGSRLAQVILQPVIGAESLWADELSTALRGTAGFGSTGLVGGQVSKPSEPIKRSAISTPFAPMVYLGGPIDYTGESTASHDWRHGPIWDEFEIYCPICRNQTKAIGDKPWLAIMDRNLAALTRADFAVFDLRMQHASVGTPIEAWQKVREAGGVYLVHPGERGVFVSAMVDAGALVVETFEQASAGIKAQIGG